MDAQVIPVASNSAVIWADPTTTTRTVSGVAPSDPVGVLLCTDGYTDREVCSVKIDATGQTVTYGGQTITGLVLAHQTSGKAAFSSGDSGGPIGTTSGFVSMYAYGMIEARNSSDPSVGWYMPARTVQSKMGVTVKHS